jgi:hypothetical protein
MVISIVVAMPNVYKHLSSGDEAVALNGYFIYL